MEYIQEIKQILINARQQSYQAINSSMIEAYWKIGQKIVVEEQHGNKKANYGEAVLKTLSKNLSVEFGKGFSSANLRNFRQFYLTYPDEQICYTLCSKLSWSHNRLIMRIDNLERNIKTLYYNRLLSSKNTLITTADESNVNIKDFIKDLISLNFWTFKNQKTIQKKKSKVF